MAEDRLSVYLRVDMEDIDAKVKAVVKAWNAFKSAINELSWDRNELQLALKKEPAPDAGRAEEAE